MPKGKLIAAPIRKKDNTVRIADSKSVVVHA